MSQKPKASKPHKEAYFVQIANPDRSMTFVNVSDRLGRPMEFTRPLATCALRVTEGAVLFSALKLYKKSLTALQGKPMQMPPGPLARLERLVAALPTAPAENELIVEFNGQHHTLAMSRDENNVVTLDMAGDAEEVVFELPRTTLPLTMFWRSPRAGRTVAAAWIGYQNKPGTPETLTRAVAYALNHLTGIGEFTVIGGIEKVVVPPPPGRYTVAQQVRKPEDEVTFDVPVRLWDGEPPTPVGAGVVKVKVDLDNANPVNGRLLFSIAPDEAVAPHWDAYRGRFELAVSEAFAHHFDSDELTDLVCNIALGEVGPGDVERLREASAKVTGFDLTPREFRLYAPGA